MTTRSALTRSEVRALLWHYRIAGEGQPIAEEMVTAWWRELRAFTAAQCHAALASISRQRVRHTTPAEVAKLAASAPADGAISTARPPLPRTSSDVARDRARFAKAGQLGIQAVYAAMGWQRHPDTDLAGTVVCPFCRAQIGQVCRPLVRTRTGKREQRDPTTRMHPSRLAKARADKAAGTTTRGGSNPPASQGVSA